MFGSGDRGGGYPVPDLGGTQRRARCTGRDLGRDRLGYSAGLVGVPEVLEHGKAGQLVPPSDPAAMADAFRTLMSDPKALVDWQARARDGAEYFTVRRMADDYTRVYRGLSRSARGRRVA